jgi:hypothetical protein
MKIERKLGLGGRYQLVSVLGEYDAHPPVDRLIVDHPPRVENAELIGMACYLAFGRWCGGELQLPVKVGPATANAMMRDAAVSGVSLLPSPIEYYPKPLPLGVREVRLSRMLRIDSAAAVYDVRVDQWAGSLRSHTSVVVPSNSFLLDGMAGNVRASLAVALLFANDVQVDSLVIEEHVPEDEKDKLAALLSAVRIGVKFSEETSQSFVRAVR